MKPVPQIVNSIKCFNDNICIKNLYFKNAFISKNLYELIVVLYKFSFHLREGIK